MGMGLFLRLFSKFVKKYVINYRGDKVYLQRIFWKKKHCLVYSSISILVYALTFLNEVASMYIT